MRTIPPAVLLLLAAFPGWNIAAEETPAEAPASDARRIGGRRELFVDEWLIEKMSGVKLHLHAPTPREVAIVFDQPWEGNTSAYVTVFEDEGRYRMYYRGSGNSREQVVCYAESKDGIRWTKPALGLWEFGGSKKNNIVWMGVGSHNFAPMRDANPDCKPDAKYKALGSGKGGLIPFKSADGIQWSMMSEKPVITEGAFDSQNLAFWDSVRERYVDFHRGFRAGKRDIMTCTSSDFLNWTDPVWLEYPGSSPEHLYTNQITPYFRAPHIFLGFPKRFVPSRRAVKHPHAGVSDGVFMTSRDGLKFRRWAEAFMRPGLQKERWVNRNNMAAWGILETQSSIPGTPNELSLYVSEGYYTGDSCQMRRHTLRLDGFVSVRAPMSGGELLTRPLVFRAPDETGKAKPGPVTVHTSRPLIGKRSLHFRKPGFITLSGTRALGSKVTFAVHVRGVASVRRRLFSAYDGGSTLPKELILDIDADGEAQEGMTVRFGYDGIQAEATARKVPSRGMESAPGTVNHIAATWDDGIIGLYLDGKKIGEGGGPGLGAIELRLGDLRFGEDYSPTGLANEPFLGFADDIVVLRRVLSDEDLAALAEEGATAVLETADESGVLYTMERDSGDTVVDQISKGKAQPTAVLEADAPGEIELLINYSTSAAGSICCEIQDATGKPIPGFTLEECDEIYGDDIERPVSWRRRREVKELAGKPVRLRFVMRDADLYSLCFH